MIASSGLVVLEGLVVFNGLMVCDGWLVSMEVCLKSGNLAKRLSRRKDSFTYSSMVSLLIKWKFVFSLEWHFPAWYFG